MNYTKPEVLFLGNASTLIERNSQHKKFTVASADILPQDPDQSHTLPGYDLDE